MVETISRRSVLKLALATAAGWYGSLLVGPFIPTRLLPQSPDYALPIEGLGMSPSFTMALRAVKITTVGKLFDLLGSNEELQKYRYPGLPDWKLFDRGRLMEIRSRLEVFAKSGPVRFATMTRLEYEVLVRIARGKTSAAIATELGSTKKEVILQTRSLYRKLGGLCAPYRDGMPW